MPYQLPQPPIDKEKNRFRRQISELGLTRMLSFPSKTELTCSISFSLSAGEETSQTDPVTFSFAALHCSKHWLSSVSFLEQVCTAAPSLANSSTIACLRDQAAEERPINYSATGSRGAENKHALPNSLGAAGDQRRRSLKRPSVRHGRCPRLASSFHVLMVSLSPPPCESKTSFLEFIDRLSFRCRYRDAALPLE